jgi:hypothetical protein
MENKPRYEVRFRDGLGDYWLLVSSSSKVVKRDDQWDGHLSYSVRAHGHHIAEMARPGNFHEVQGDS